MRLLSLFFILIIINLLCGLGYVYSEHQHRQLFAELQSLNNRTDELEIEWRLLQLEQSTLTAQSVIDYKARTRLGMFVPHPYDVVYLQP